MEQRKKLITEENGDSIGKNDTTSLLKGNITNGTLISRNFMADKSMTNSNSNSNSLTMLQLINRFNSSNSMNNQKKIPPDFPIPKIPSPKIPIQFRLASAKLNYIKLGKSVALDVKKIPDSVSTVTTSATDFTTVNHTNRSLVYSESVSTKGTAPTKNIIEINTSDFATNLSNNPNNSIYSPRIGVANNSSALVSKFGVPYTYSFLVPATHSNSNESVNGTGIDSIHTNHTHHLEQTSDVPISNLESSIHRDLQNQYSEQVNNRY